MCGRYTQTLSADELATAMSAADETGGGLRVSHNVAPTREMPIVAARRPADGENVESARVLRLATWGLVPAWAKERSIGSRLINARAETVASKPAFRAAFAARRCLVPATGFYEWRRVDGTGRGQPYYIHPAGHPGADGLFAFAGIYEVWRQGEQPLTTFSVITTDAAAGLEFLHDRSPVVVPRSAWSRWIDPRVRDAADLAGILRPAPAGVFAAHPVAAAVGSVRNDFPGLIDPVEADEGPAARASAAQEPARPGRPASPRVQPGTAPAVAAGPGPIPLHEDTLFDKDGVRSAASS